MHLIFVTKYRKKLFYNNLKEDVKQYLYEAASILDCRVIQMETDKDHVHLLLEYKPSQKISDIVKHLKQHSTTEIWNKYTNILQSIYWRQKKLWSDGYFACSIGQVSQTTIERYIQNQG